MAPPPSISPPCWSIVIIHSWFTHLRWRKFTEENRWFHSGAGRGREAGARWPAENNKYKLYLIIYNVRIGQTNWLDASELQCNICSHARSRTTLYAETFSTYRITTMHVVTDSGIVFLESMAELKRKKAKIHGNDWGLCIWFTMWELWH